MTNQLPSAMVLPVEVIRRWATEYKEAGYAPEAVLEYVAWESAQWGADQQLEECCEQVKSIPSPFGVPLGEMASNALRNACRPKPPSLKEQALEQLDEISNCFRASHGGPIVCDKIRKALEALPDD